VHAPCGPLVQWHSSVHMLAATSFASLASGAATKCCDAFTSRRSQSCMTLHAGCSVEVPSPCSPVKTSLFPRHQPVSRHHRQQPPHNNTTTMTKKHQNKQNNKTKQKNYVVFARLHPHSSSPSLSHQLTRCTRPARQLPPSQFLLATRFQLPPACGVAASPAWRGSQVGGTRHCKSSITTSNRYYLDSVTRTSRSGVSRGDASKGPHTCGARATSV